MRPELLNPLFAPVAGLHGVGPALQKPLERLGLSRVVDLLFHLPTGWTRRRPVESLTDAASGDLISVVVTPFEIGASRGRGPTRIYALDGSGNTLTLAFFGGAGRWARQQLPLGEPKRVSGRVESYRDELQMAHPDHMVAPDEPLADVEPIYALSEGITSRRLAALVDLALERLPEMPEWIEPGLLAKKEWPGFGAAVRAAHGEPESRLARDRLGYDEVFANQLALTLIRNAVRTRRGRPLAGDGRLTGALRLPFALTGAQQRANREIGDDLRQNQPMLRLLQGDVGSGKTLVAAMALLTAVEAGGQGALLAPTEILARQHLASLEQLLRGLPVTVAALTGRDKGRAREGTLMGLADGSIDIAVGTHAIFQQAVSYRDLSLVVVDEQHRFGVSERLLMAAKGAVQPHMLTMTATPIPRSLALTRFGEMDVSVLNERPPGRQPIDTRVISVERLEEVIAGLGRHLDGAGQAYWVCPLVEESVTSDLAAAEERFRELSKRFPGRVGLVHGRMAPPEKDAAMSAFSSGETGVLVATTVIEVGVDVPNATLMVIEGADRFGLAQLHQLRGRVGRGEGKSVCLLLRSDALSETGRKRLALLRETNDGFRIAEADLELRGAGEMLGTRQAGEARFRLAEPEGLAAALATATDDARLLIDRDGGLEGERGTAARLALYLFERDAAVRLLGSG